MKNSTFKMKGFPQHAGVSPMKQNEGTKARGRYDKIKRENEETRNNPVIVESSEHDIALDEQIQAKTIRENKEKLATKKANRKQVATDLVEGIGMDLAKATAVTAVGKMFDKKKKKKEPTRIIGKDWKIT